MDRIITVNFNLKKMPIDYKKYPKNWKTEIVPAIKANAGHCCEFCGVKNYQVGYWNANRFMPVFGNDILDKAGNGELPYKEAREVAKDNQCFEDQKLIVIVLTVAHLDHNIEHNDFSNLRALCQRCHLNYDKEHHAKNRAITNKNKKRQTEINYGL